MDNLTRGTFVDCLYRLNKMILYKNIKENPAIMSFIKYIQSYIDNISNSLEYRSNFILELISQAEDFSLKGNIFAKVFIKSFLEDENIYSLACERDEFDKTSTLHELATAEIENLQSIINMDISLLIDDSKISDIIINYEPMLKNKHNYFSEYISSIYDLKEDSVEKIEMKIRSYYKIYGCGEISRCNMFRYNKGDILSIENNDQIILDDIIGYNSQKKILIDNTEAFISGYNANNALLVGARGTGKSSMIKAIANHYYNRGLKLLELPKDQLKDISFVLNTLKNRGKHFIIFLDDLSFEDFETEYKYLKSLLEGSVEIKPKNVLFYATSNRRHIIQEKWDDKDKIVVENGEIHSSDVINEKLSLSNRFGLTVTFPKPSSKQYIEIVKGIAKSEGIDLPEEFLESDATKWELNQNGLSGRTARQYINSLFWRINS